MRILFVGTVHFSRVMLRRLLEIDADVVGVITGPDTGRNADYADLTPICRENNITCLVTDDINCLDTIAWVKDKSPDLILCLGWSRLLEQEFLSAPKMGVVGFHPTELPKNRGRHPLIWTLALGLKQTASTFFFMDRGADSGDILSQEVVQVSKDDDALSLYKKLEHVAKGQLVEMLNSLESGRNFRVKQDAGKASYWRKRTESDGRIDWRMSSSSIHNLVRALSFPYPGAEFSMNDRIYKVWKSSPLVLEGVDNIEPGKVVDFTDNGNVVIKCGEGCIELLDVEPALNVDKGRYI